MKRRARRNSLLVLLVLAPVVALAAPRNKSDATRHDLKKAEAAQAADRAAQKDAADRAAHAAAEEQKLAAERIEAAARLRQAEATTEDAVLRLEALATARREAAARLAARAESLRPLLPLILRLAMYPTETLLAVPATTEDRLRGVMVLQGLSHQIEREAEALRRDQAALDAATRALEQETPKYAAAVAAQAAQAAALDRQIAAAQALRRQAEGEAEAASRKAAAEAARTETLRNALAVLEARQRAEEARQRAAEEARARDDAAVREDRRRRAEDEAARQKVAAAAPPVGVTKGPFVAPVAGRVVRSWGEATEGGPAAGLSYQAAPAARVVAPCSGRVMFADAFRSYGLLTIMDCGGGHHLVLAGFERLDVRVGQTVHAGEPVGVMPTWDPASGGRRPSLYVELRHDGRPVNPAPLLRAGG